MSMRYEGEGGKEKQIRSYVRKRMILSCHPHMFSPKKEMFSESLYLHLSTPYYRYPLSEFSRSLYVSFARMTIDKKLPVYS